MDELISVDLFETMFETGSVGEGESAASDEEPFLCLEDNNAGENLANEESECAASAGAPFISPLQLENLGLSGMFH